MAGDPQHPGNDYFVQPNTGTIQRQSNPFGQAALRMAGFVGPMTWDQAQTALKIVPKAEQGTPVGNATQAAKGAYNAAQNTLTGVTAIGDFFQRLTSKATWERVGEFAIGALLIYIGLKATVTPDSAGKVANRTFKQTAKTTAKLFASSPAGKARAVRQEARRRSNRTIHNARVREQTGQNLMKAKRRHGRAPK